MRINLNGKEINNGTFKNLEELVTSSFTKIEGTIVELNGKIVRKNLWKEHLLQENDKIEVIQFVGGG